MPLCTILTKCPAPSGPMCVQQGTPSTCAEISSSSGPSGLVRLGRAARHDRRPVQCALLTAGDAGADEVQPALAYRLLASNGVGVERIAAVDDDVAFFHRVGELVDHGVGGVTGLHHDQHPARFLQGGEKLFDGLRAHEFAFAAVLFEQRIGLGDRPVVQRHGVAVMGEVAGDVRTHDGQAGHADLRGAHSVVRFRRAHVFASHCRDFHPSPAPNTVAQRDSGICKVSPKRRVCLFAGLGSGEQPVQFGEPGDSQRDGGHNQHRRGCQVGGCRHHQAVAAAGKPPYPQQCVRTTGG